MQNVGKPQLHNCTTRKRESVLFSTRHDASKPESPHEEQAKHLAIGPLTLDLTTRSIHLRDRCASLLALESALIGDRSMMRDNELRKPSIRTELT